ncbi:MAG: hypothetical protein U1F41_01090 [Burkholderiales bacterium]
MHGEASARENVAQALLRYWRAHPDAADTLEGVVKWWLPRQRFLDARERVEEALELLVQRDIIEKFPSPSGVVYRCVRTRATSRQ